MCTTKMELLVEIGILREIKIDTKTDRGECLQILGKSTIRG